jgi:predicted Zn-dependent peptidase
MKTRKHIPIKKINGYTVIMVPTPIDTMIVRASVSAGFIHESPETLGIHHLIEHVLVDSSKQCHPNCMLYWDKEGCILNATTENTTVNYFVKGLPDIAEKMIDYITTILTRPKLSDLVLQREKKAVLSELKMMMNVPDYKLSNEFNKVFYVPYGLRYTNDASRQIQNLQTITLGDLQQVHSKLYTPSNMVFVVYGKFSESLVVRAFKRCLPISSVVYSPPTCFSYTPSFIHVPHKSSTVMTMIGFPLRRQYEYSMVVQKILSVLLLNELRTKHKFVYGIQCSVNTDHCSTCLILQFECIQEVFVKTLRTLFHALHQCATTSLDPSVLKGVQRRFTYAYSTDYDYDVYYSSYVYYPRPLLTKKQLIRHVNSFQANMFQSFMKEMIQFNQCTVAYQYPTSFDLDWNTFLKIDARGTTHLLS